MQLLAPCLLSTNCAPRHNCELLLKSEFEPRLSDFGVAKLLNPDKSNWTTIVGSYGYMAPGKLTI